MFCWDDVGNKVDTEGHSPLKAPDSVRCVLWKAPLPHPACPQSNKVTLRYVRGCKALTKHRDVLSSLQNKHKEKKTEMGILTHRVKGKRHTIKKEILDKLMPLCQWRYTHKKN